MAAGAVERAEAMVVATAAAMVASQVAAGGSFAEAGGPIILPQLKWRSHTTGIGAWATGDSSMLLEYR